MYVITNETKLLINGDEVVVGNCTETTVNGKKYRVVASGDAATKLANSLESGGKLCVQVGQKTLVRVGVQEHGAKVTDSHAGRTVNDETPEYAKNVEFPAGQVAVQVDPPRWNDENTFGATVWPLSVDSWSASARLTAVVDGQVAPSVCAYAPVVE